MRRLTWDTSLDLGLRERVAQTIRRVVTASGRFRHRIAETSRPRPQFRRMAAVAPHVRPRHWQHGVVLSLGVSAALVAWSQPKQSQQFWDVVSIVADHVADRIDDIQDIALSAFQPRTHVVEPGETLRQLADAYDVSVATIAWSNRLMDPDRIMPGQRLLIPAGNSVIHPVREGDTLNTVAARYETDPTELANANQLSPDALDEPIETSQLIVPNPKLPDVNEIGAPEGKMSSAVKNALVYEVQEGDTLPLAGKSVRCDRANASEGKRYRGCRLTEHRHQAQSDARIRRGARGSVRRESRRSRWLVRGGSRSNRRFQRTHRS